MVTAQLNAAKGSMYDELRAKYDAAVSENQRLAVVEATHRCVWVGAGMCGWGRCLYGCECGRGYVGGRWGGWDQSQLGSEACRRFRGWW